MLTFILFLLATKLKAQKSWTNKYTVNKNFKVGAVQVYDVNEFYKVDNIFFGRKENVKSTVFIQVVDTFRGGYFMQYHTLMKQKDIQNDSTAYIMSLLMNKVNFIMYFKNGDFIVDSTSYYRNNESIKSICDSLNKSPFFGETNKAFIKEIQFEIKRNDGIQFFLGPLILIQQYFSNFEYKEFPIYSFVSNNNIFNKKLYTGKLTTIWKNTKKDGTIVLQNEFTGDPATTAQHYQKKYEQVLIDKNIKYRKKDFPDFMRYESTTIYNTKTQNAFPIRIYNKTTGEYLFRFVERTEMNALIE
ncbi:hypothetical protein ACFOWM_12280 [Ferruginibacter yonginensis]|uniref:Uncharacterized protein n=1 Tax=Ferruginibacter yonginensis TaxID=1310416 RepID=A0ABV8QVE9_9BACT